MEEVEWNRVGLWEKERGLEIERGVGRGREKGVKLKRGVEHDDRDGWRGRWGDGWE